MAAGEGGSIINVSSIAAVAPTAAEVPYGAAKAGLNNLTQTGNYFLLYGNPALTSLTGLDQLTSIGESLGIIDNDSLTYSVPLLPDWLTF